jgi:hypothetical protein
MAQNPNIGIPEKPFKPPSPPEAPKYIAPKEPPTLKGFMVGPGPDGKKDTYTIWLVTTKAEKVMSKTLLEVCYFGLQEVLDSITNHAFDIFFLKLEPDDK